MTAAAVTSPFAPSAVMVAQDEAARVAAAREAYEAEYPSPFTWDQGDEDVDLDAVRAALGVRVDAARAAETDDGLPPLAAVAELLELSGHELAVWTSYTSRGGALADALHALLETHDERDTPIGGDGPQSLGLESAVTQGSPIVAAIFERARAGTGQPWAALAWALATVASAIPPHVVLPPPGVAGSPGSLNLQFCLVGRSGKGKGVSAGVLDLVVRDRAYAGGLDRLPIPARVAASSGEAIASQYVHVERDPETKKVEVVHHATSAWFDWPEIDRLTSSKGRQSSTLDSETRQMWSGESLGGVTRGESLVCPGGTYRSVVTVSTQPGRAGALFAERDGGTLQRTLFFDASHDPRARVVSGAQHGPLDIYIPNFRVRDEGPTERVVLDVADAVRATLQAHRVADSSGDAEVGPLDTHSNFNRLKLAAIFALMHTRTAVTAADWTWAGWIIEHSTRVRDGLIAQLDEKEEAAARVSGALRGIERVAADEAAQVEREEAESRRWAKQKASLLAWIKQQDHPVTEAEVKRNGGRGTLRKTRPLELLGELCDDGLLVVASVAEDDEPWTWAATR